MSAQPLHDPLDKEAWLAARLKLHDIFAGDTDPAKRKARMRETIERRGCADTRCAHATTFRQAFERCYSEPL